LRGQKACLIEAGVNGIEKQLLIAGESIFVASGEKDIGVAEHHYTARPSAKMIRSELDKTILVIWQLS
jgi:hypothetical protein